jgi:hypothetical protein
MNCRLLMLVIPDARSAIRNPGANAPPFDHLGSGFSPASSAGAPRNDKAGGTS